MHFQDDTWVKLAVLTWDRIARVHPPDLPSRDSELVRRMLDDLHKALRRFGIESAAGSLGPRVDLNAATGTVLGGIAAAGGQLALAAAVGVVPYVAGRLPACR